MSKSVTRLFDTHTEALAAVEALEVQGVDRDHISIVSSNADNWHNGHKHAGGAMGDANHDGENDVAEGAGKGATTGGVLGGGAGLLAGLGMLAIPGLGPVVAVGWLAAAAVGAAVGAVAGGATGGLLGALKEAGHSDEEANVYAEGVRRGGALVSVRVKDDERARIEALLNANRGVDADRRGQAYRADGWSGFDQGAGPYTVDQIARERQIRAEARSFAADDSVDGVEEFGADDRRSDSGDDVRAINPDRSF